MHQEDSSKPEKPEIEVHVFVPKARLEKLEHDLWELARLSKRPNAYMPTKEMTYLGRRHFFSESLHDLRWKVLRMLDGK